MFEPQLKIADSSVFIYLTMHLTHFLMVMSVLMRKPHGSLMRIDLRLTVHQTGD